MLHISISNLLQKSTRKVSSLVNDFFQMIWNMTLDLCINYKNYFAITFGYYHTLVLVIHVFSIFLMVVQLNTKTTTIS